MVWRRMGLLDDAIREHLELKRRRGADPGEIAHEERAALEPVFAEEAPPPDGAPSAAGEEPAEHEYDGAAAEVQAPSEVPAGERLDVDSRLADFSSVGQETAELDMDAVLHEDGEHPAAGAAAAHAEAAPAAEDDLFEWEAPGASAAVPEEIPGQERLTFE